MNLLKSYYLYCADILKEHLPYIPEVILTNAKTYYGQAYRNREDGIVFRISISKFNHIDSEWLLDKEDRDDIIDTICHELAHILVWEHNDLHKQFTENFVKLVNIDSQLRFPDVA